MINNVHIKPEIEDTTEVFPPILSQNEHAEAREWFDSIDTGYTGEELDAMWAEEMAERDEAKRDMERFEGWMRPEVA